MNDAVRGCLLAGCLVILRTSTPGSVCLMSTSLRLACFVTRRRSGPHSGQISSEQDADTSRAAPRVRGEGLLLWRRLGLRRCLFIQYLLLTFLQFVEDLARGLA